MPAKSLRKPPSGNPVLDRSHPAAKNMVACYIMNSTSGLMNIANPTDSLATITGTPTKSNFAQGTGTKRFSPGIDFDGSSMITIPTANRWGIDFNGGAFSAYIVADADANGSVLGMFQAFGLAWDWGFTWQNLGIIGNTWESGNTVWTIYNADAPTDAFQVFYQFNGNNVERVAWFNRTRNTTTTYRAHSTSSGNNLYLGGNWSGTASHNGRIYALYIWNKSISEKIYTNYLYQNPYCILKSGRKRTRYVAAGGGASFKSAWARNSNSLIYQGVNA